MDFINSPAQYLEKVKEESVVITKEGQDIAVLAKPDKTPISDSLLGIIKGMDIKTTEDIKKARLGE
jgi:hypothetical protein